MFADASSKGQRPQILLVEDDEVFLKVIEIILKKEGYDVLSASSFTPAIKYLDSEDRIDLLLTDITMPQQVNGIALARMARLRRRGLPVIHYTGYDIPGLSEYTDDEILKKPFENEELLNAIKRALSRYSG
jgi:CheY-like chemotaxis protein